jgi:hypothetical protein
MNTDEAIESYYSLRPAAFDIVARLEVREVLDSGESPELMLEIELLQDQGKRANALLWDIR